MFALTGVGREHPGEAKQAFSVVRALITVHSACSVPTREARISCYRLPALTNTPCFEVFPLCLVLAGVSQIRGFAHDLLTAACPVGVGQTPVNSWFPEKMASLPVCSHGSWSRPPSSLAGQAEQRARETKISLLHGNSP